jgi:S-DNA-T family DNA segregation ATPase FtsK/SpoIIIE
LSLSFLSLIAHRWRAESVPLGSLSIGGEMGGVFSENLMGPSGHAVATLLWGLMGWCGLVPAVCAFWLAWYCWNLDRSSKKSSDEPAGGAATQFLLRALRKAAGFGGVFAASCVTAAVLFGPRGGGSVGMAVAEPLTAWFSSFGASFIAFSVLLLSLAMSTNLSVLELGLRGIRQILVLIGLLAQVPIIIAKGVWWLLGAIAWSFGKGLTATGLRDFLEKNPRQHTIPPARVRRNTISEERDSPDEDESEEDEEDEDSQGDSPDVQMTGEATDLPQDDAPMTHVVVSRKQRESRSGERQFVRTLPLPGIAPHPSAGGEETSPEAAVNRFEGYEPPPLSLLTRGELTTIGEADEELLEKSRQIEAKLRDFGVLGKVTQVHPGPVITLFEFEPAPGVKVGRIAALQDDLAMSLRASSIRIIAPIPKRGTVGIEVPNKHRDLVRLRDVLESDQFVHDESILSVCIGKDTYGEPVVVDIASMPHLLIAGATGTGKSVCINALLLSLLYRAHPAELGLILIDPKILELSLYNSIPHLRVPVVSHPRQAKAVLQWAVDEMHRRYRLMEKFAVRNIDGYNRIVNGDKEEKDSESAPPLDEQVVMLTDEEVIEEGTVSPHEEDEAKTPHGLPTEKLQPLPKIVIVIDELADLMLAAGRDIEELITRLAQKARASGIHLIVATQRPSVDVITGLIKANFPARLSFRVSSRVDSRTILDSMGAERLLGRGDMLLMLPGAEAVRRVHGAFVSDSEVKRAVTHIKQACKPKYDERIMRVCEQALEEESKDRGEGGGEGGDSEYDEVYDKAVELVVEKGQASTSMIQRVFRIGYNRAARIIETMERDGIVGPMDGVKPREVLMPPPESEPRG